MTSFQDQRRAYQPSVPLSLMKPFDFCLRKKSLQRSATPHLRPIFPKTYDQKGYELVAGQGKKTPLRIGVLFSGGQASGGHNVIAGIWDLIQKIHTSSQLIGFLDGPSGLIEKKWRYLKALEIDQVRNTGGFDLIGTGRTKIETAQQISSCMQTCNELTLDGLVIVGGDDSNTNAAILAEYFLMNGCSTRVVGVPKTIDGDLKSEEIEISFGFDSACKTYAELIGNIAKDVASSKKYYHFIKLMGRSASHIALECALATQPNLCLIGEEGKSLDAIVKEIADLICSRKEEGKEHGVILVPEGLIEFIPEMKALILELMAKGSGAEHLKPKTKALFSSLPEKIQKQLLLDRDPHGNLTLSQIETEVMLAYLVKQELAKRPSYKGKFSPVTHFFGYEGRSCYPSNFDANYTYALGRLAAIAVRDDATGVICAISKLAENPKLWECSCVPIVLLMHMEERKGVQKPVIQKALVDLKGKAFLAFAKMRESWATDDVYLSPGPMQFFGGPEITDLVPKTLQWPDA